MRGQQRLLQVVQLVRKVYLIDMRVQNPQIFLPHRILFLLAIGLALLDRRHVVDALAVYESNEAALSAEVETEAETVENAAAIQAERDA